MTNEDLRAIQEVREALDALHAEQAKGDQLRAELKARRQARKGA